MANYSELLPRVDRQERDTDISSLVVGIGKIESRKISLARWKKYG